MLLTFWASAQNLSTGIDNFGNALTVGSLDPNWVIVSSPDGCNTPTVMPAYLPYWEATPIPGTNAGWLDCTGNIQGSTPGDYVFERSFTVGALASSFSCNFRVTYDDILVSLELVSPTSTVTPLTVVPTTGYHLSQLVNHVETSPTPGVWKIRATINFFDSVGGFMLSGDVTSCDSLLPGNLQSGLIAYYPFNGGSLMDYSPSGFNLTNPSAVPTPTTDRNGYPNCAYRFSGGVTEFLTAAMPAGIIPSASSPFSISLWYSPQSTAAVTYELLFGRGTGFNCPDGTGEISLELYDCRKPVMRFNQYSSWDYTLSGAGSCLDIANLYIANGWQHLVAVYDPSLPPGSQYLIYRNGLLSNSPSGTCGTPYVDAGNLYIGTEYLGLIDDIFFFDRPLSVTEVYQLQGLGSSCCSGNIVGTIDAPSMEVEFFPNPTMNRVGLRIPASISSNGVRVEAMDALGRIVLQQSIAPHTGESEITFDLSGYAAGVYIFKIAAGENVAYKRVLKQ